MNNRHKAAVWLVAALAILTSGCGDTFRPIAGPLPQPGGNPGSPANAIIVSSSGTTAPGSTTQIDVSGDTTVAIHPVGINPVQAVAIGPRTFVINQGDSAGAGSTVTDYLTFGGAGTSATTTTLTGTCPTFADTRDTSHLFVAVKNSSGVGGCSFAGAGAVSVVSALSLIEAGVIPVGTDPESLAELPSASELYVANKGSNNVTVINVVDSSITVPAIAVGTAPSYVVASPDSACVYVANSGEGTVSVINTASHTVVSTIPTGAGPSFMKFDPNLGRVYVANTGGNSVSVLSHNTACTPALLATTSVGIAPKSIAPLADGTRFYVANSGDNTVSVVDAGSFKVRSTILVAASPVSVAAASDSSRVYSANSGGSISIITPSNDQVLETVNAPACSAPTGSTTPACAMQSPDFVMVFP